MFQYIGKKDDFKLTNENYYTQEAMSHYMSIHPFISFIGTPGIIACEERTIHDIEYPIEPTDNMIIGSYIDAYFEGGGLKSSKRIIHNYSKKMARYIANMKCAI